MSYTPNADDATQPTIIQLASSAALEFRTLKTKINKLFLSSAFNDTDNTVDFFRGSSWINQSSGPNLVYGVIASATRTGGTGSIFAGVASAVIGNNVNLASTTLAAGLNVEMWTSPVNSSASSDTGLFGEIISVLQQNPAGQVWSRGLEVGFYNRPLGTAAAVSGLGADLYNKQATGISIRSQQRGTDGAKCGWVAGIRFENYALDEDSFTTQHPTAIDFTGLGLTNASIEPVHFNFNDGRVITSATDNTGSVTAPTTYRGFIRVSIDGNANYAIPVCHLPL